MENMNPSPTDLFGYLRREWGRTGNHLDAEIAVVEKFLGFARQSLQDNPVVAHDTLHGGLGVRLQDGTSLQLSASEAVLPEDDFGAVGMAGRGKRRGLDGDGRTAAGQTFDV